MGTETTERRKSKEVVYENKDQSMLDLGSKHASLMSWALKPKPADIPNAADAAQALDANREAPGALQTTPAVEAENQTKNENASEATDASPSTSEKNLAQPTALETAAQDATLNTTPLSDDGRAFDDTGLNFVEKDEMELLLAIKEDLIDDITQELWEPVAMRRIN